MHTEPRRIPRLAREFVKFIILLVRDFVLRFQPQRLDRIDALAVELDREADKVRVLFDDALNVVESAVAAEPVVVLM